MRFRQTPTTLAFDTLRLESDGWEFGVRRVIFGWRVSANPLGWDSYLVDYCAGAQLFEVDEVFALLYRILHAQSDTVQPRELKAMLQTWERRPIHRDADCVPRLRELALAMPWSDEDTREFTPLLTAVAEAMQGATPGPGGL